MVRDRPACLATADPHLVPRPRFVRIFHRVREAGVGVPLQAFRGNGLDAARSALCAFLCRGSRAGQHVVRIFPAGSQTLASPKIG